MKPQRIAAAVTSFFFAFLAVVLIRALVVFYQQLWAWQP